MEHYKATYMKEAKDNGAIRFRLTSKVVDRDGEVVLPKGAVLKNFKKNPAVRFMHGWTIPDIPNPGKIDIGSIEIEEDFFDADVILDEENDPFAKLLASKYRNGFMNAGSIGFIPIAVSKEPVVEGQKGVTFTKWELLEYSLVSIPSNPDSLQTDEWKEFKGLAIEMGVKGDWDALEVLAKSCNGVMASGALDLRGLLAPKDPKVLTLEKALQKTDINPTIQGAIIDFFHNRPDNDATETLSITESVQELLNSLESLEGQNHEPQEGESAELRSAMEEFEKALEGFNA